MMTIDSLILDSTNTNSSVVVAHDADLRWSIICESEGYAEIDGALDAWGTTEDGAEWRIWMDAE